MSFVGEDVSALVFDVGTRAVRGGFAGEDTPKALFSTQIGVREHEDSASSKGGDGDVEMGSPDKKRSFFVGDNNLGFVRNDMEMMSPMASDGLIGDWDALEAILEYTMSDALGVDCKDYALIWGEPSYNTREDRERFTELMFEKFSVPALFLSKTGVLSAFSCGKSSALVVDVGEQTVVTPVHDGYALRKCAVRSPLGGGVLTSETLNILQQQVGSDAALRAPFEIKTKREVDGIGSGNWEVTFKSDAQLAGVTDSYRNWKIRTCVGQDAKETVGSVWKDDSYNDQRQDIANLPSLHYELPDGKVVAMGAERYDVGEILFDPVSLETAPDGVSEGDLAAMHASGGVATMALNAISKCDADIRRELLSSVVVVGGSTLMDGFAERLYYGMSNPATDSGVAPPPNYRVRVTASPNAVERRHAAWIGGSILGSLGSFQKMWLSRAEFEEHGRTIVERKCP